MEKGNLNSHTTLDLETKITFTVEQFHSCPVVRPVPIMGRCLEQGDGCCVTRSDKTRESSNIHNCSYSFCNFIQLEKKYLIWSKLLKHNYIFSTHKCQQFHPMVSHIDETGITVYKIRE